MDPAADTLYGPYPIQKIGTVTVPRGLLQEIGIDRGSEVHWALNPDLPGTLILIPKGMIAGAMPGIIAALKGTGPPASGR